MNANNSIIAIRKKDIRLAHQAFADLMDKTENILNEEAFANPDEYKQLTSSSLESCAVEKIKLACADSPFDASEVELISGQRFPDIVAEKYYGIEVKSTKEDHWTVSWKPLVLKMLMTFICYLESLEATFHNSSVDHIKMFCMTSQLHILRDI